MIGDSLEGDGNVAKYESMVGQTFVNIYGVKYEVIHHKSRDDVVVRFKGGYEVKTNTTYCRNGKIRSPFAKRVCGIGYLGLDENGNIPSSEDENGKKLKSYDLWASMIKRCYSGKHPTWEGCQVCERWQCYSNFLKDLPHIDNYELWLNGEDVHLDKDIKGNSKLYSLDNCKFVSISTNSRERMLRRDNPNPEKQVIGVNMATGEATLYHGVRTAQRALGLKYHSGISKTCLHKMKYAYGHYWYFLQDFDKLFPDKEYQIYSSCKEETWAKQNMDDFSM